MKFTSITQIQNHQFVGNACADEQAFNAIHRFVMNAKHSLTDRAEALRVMSDKGMGCGRDEDTSDEDIVASYIDECGDDVDFDELNESEDTPMVANCDDWGTGEGRFHGRM